MDTRVTLREFSIKVANKKGVQFHIFYGYDLSKSTPRYYVKASIDGKPISDTKATLKRISSLGIEPINHLISLIGCDESGAITDIDEVVFNVFDANEDNTASLLTEILRLNEEKDIEKLETVIMKFVEMHKQGKSEKALRGIVKRYLKSQRLRLLLDVRETVQVLRKLFYKGVELHGIHYTVKHEGYLDQNHYPTYYKRDMDLIRASRIRIYTEILNKQYIPVND